PQDRIGDQRRQHGAGRGAGQQAEGKQQHGRQAGELFLDQAGREGADADEGGMAEARIACEAAQDRPGKTKPRGVEHELPDPHVEGRQEERPGRQQHGRCNDHDQNQRRIALHREAAKALPSRPCGRTSNSSTSSKNMVTLGNAGPTYCAVRVLTKPSSSPPIKAPAGLPTPPSTTTTKALSVQVPSSLGENGKMMPITMPAAPAKAAET